MPASLASASGCRHWLISEIPSSTPSAVDYHTIHHSLCWRFLTRTVPPMYRLSLLALSLVVTCSAAQDRPLSPEDAAKAMTLPRGFEATLFAGEPDVVQPIAMTFDDRGRLWVVECVSYPKWATDGKGTDRVVILEDTDGDGVHDKRTVFLDNGVNLSGIEYGFGGIWLCSSPNLVFVPDRNGDDKPDGPPEMILDGWNIKDTKHNIFNSLGW